MKLTGNDFKTIRLLLNLDQIEFCKKYSECGEGKKISRVTLISLEHDRVQIKERHWEILKKMVRSHGPHRDQIPEELYSHTNEYLEKFLQINSFSQKKKRLTKKDILPVTRIEIALLEEVFNYFKMSGDDEDKEKKKENNTKSKDFIMWKNTLNSLKGNSSFTEKTVKRNLRLRLYPEHSIEMAIYEGQIIINCIPKNDDREDFYSLVCINSSQVKSLPSWLTQQLSIYLKMPKYIKEILNKLFDVKKHISILSIDLKNKKSNYFSTQEVERLIAKQDQYIDSKYDIQSIKKE